ncbi:hypothetical protein E2C01_081499 [Portunus trituberculatus]|uniref:Uncharacterized protein n=1 Tax=Portunus trituberculatus TaxID=210409 RepID=A0A5B7J2H7_PORTR|nr:hypothetical protein [Portunus trituberculatus]
MKIMTTPVVTEQQTAFQNQALEHTYAMQNDEQPPNTPRPSNASTQPPPRSLPYLSIIPLCLLRYKKDVYGDFTSPRLRRRAGHVVDDVAGIAYELILLTKLILSSSSCLAVCLSITGRSRAITCLLRHRVPDKAIVTLPFVFERVTLVIF